METGPKYTAVFEQEADGGYCVSVPALPGCHSQGDSFDEAEWNDPFDLDDAIDAIEGEMLDDFDVELVDAPAPVDAPVATPMADATRSPGTSVFRMGWLPFNFTFEEQAEDFEGSGTDSDSVNVAEVTPDESN